MNLSTIRNLTNPISYLRIRHKQKSIVDWILPLGFSALSILTISMIGEHSSIKIYEEGGLLSKILAFTQSLPGFYIAALAAIATFNKKGIDAVMPTPAPKLDTLRQGRKVTIELTRRMFLCMMFAFLTAESIAITAFIIFGQSLHTPIIYTDTTTHQKSILSVTYVSLILFMFWQMIITTMWGLYYLGDRIHRND